MRLPSLSSRLTRNALAGILGRIWYLLLWVLVTPYVLTQLGEERFGVWSLLFLLSGYLATFDLGLAPTVVRFTADHAAREDWSGLRGTIGEILRVHVLLGILWIVLVFAGTDWLLQRIGLGAGYQDEVRFTIRFSCIVFALANLINSGAGVLNGLQRMDVSNGILVLASIPQLAVLLWGLAAGHGLYSVAWSAAAHAVVSAMLVWLSLRRLASQLQWPTFFAPGSGARWFGFGTAMQVTNFIVFAQHQADKVVLTALAGVAAVTRFELGYRIANGIQSLPTLALAPLIPAFAEAHAQGDRGRFRDLWHRSTELLAVVALGLGSIAAVTAPLVMTAWVGPAYPDAGALAQWMIGGFSILLLAGASTAAARGGGRADLEIVPGIIGLAIHVLASFLLVRQTGLVGCGPGFFLGLVTWGILIQVRFASWSGIGLRPFWSAIRSSAGAALASIVAGGVVGRALAVESWPGRAGAFGGACVLAAIQAAVYGFSWWLLSTLRPIGGKGAGAGPPGSGVVA